MADSVYCPHCETACSPSAPACPKCGHPLQKQPSPLEGLRQAVSGKPSSEAKTIADPWWRDPRVWNPREWKKAIGLFVLAFVVVLVVNLSLDWPSSVARPEPEFVINAPRLWREYEENEIAADYKYKEYFRWCFGIGVFSRRVNPGRKRRRASGRGCGVYLDVWTEKTPQKRSWHVLWDVIEAGKRRRTLGG